MSSAGRGSLMCGQSWKSTANYFSSASETPPPPPPRKEDIPPKYYVPKTERGSGREIFDMDDTVGRSETRLSRNSRTCPTRELYFLNQQWGRHKSPYRKFRHMSNFFRSAPFQLLIFPDLFTVSAIAAGVTYYNEFVANTAVAVVSASETMTAPVLGMSPATFAGATTAIGLLAGFRLNASYGRYREGRQYWSDTSTALRDLARQSMMWIRCDDASLPDKDNKQQQQQELKQAQTRMARLCQAFPNALMFHLNDKGCHHNMKRASKTGEAPFKDCVQAEFRAELYDIRSDVPPLTEDDDGSNNILSDDLERICRVKYQGGNAPLEVITCMAETISSCADKNVHPVYIRELDVQVQRLCEALGSSEKVLKMPLPTGFTRHSSRLLFIWSTCLPFALYPLLGPFGTLPTCNWRNPLIYCPCGSTATR